MQSGILLPPKMTEDEIRAIKIEQARKRMEFSTLIGK
jgi:hypothetical protein